MMTAGGILVSSRSSPKDKKKNTSVCAVCHIWVSNIFWARQATLLIGVGLCVLYTRLAFTLLKYGEARHLPHIFCCIGLKGESHLLYPVFSLLLLGVRSTEFFLVSELRGGWSSGSIASNVTSEVPLDAVPIPSCCTREAVPM